LVFTVFLKQQIDKLFDSIDGAVDRRITSCPKIYQEEEFLQQDLYVF
jgi:hypothetical protein